MQKFRRFLLFFLLTQFALPDTQSAPLHLGREEVYVPSTLYSPALMLRAMSKDSLLELDVITYIDEDRHGEENLFHAHIDSNIVFGKNVVPGDPSAGGKNNAGVWDVISYNGHKSDLVAKFLTQAYCDTNGWQEAKALEMKGDLIVSGLVKRPLPGSSPLPVIIMKKKHGKSCHDLQLTTKGKHHITDVDCQKALCNQVADDAIRFRLYRHDNVLGNGLFSIDKKGILQAEIVDYGHAYLVIDKNAKSKVFYDACMDSVAKH
ncbi:hypothetical protein C8R42DRAFT_657318 [Lentinula raphanica]|nr:hypothetical protein C8R42DRAFT_657318 [Lentinula raphanica]